MFVTRHLALELGALDVGAHDLWERNRERVPCHPLSLLPNLSKFVPFSIETYGALSDRSVGFRLTFRCTE